MLSGLFKLYDVCSKIIGTVYMIMELKCAELSSLADIELCLGCKGSYKVLVHFRCL